MKKFFVFSASLILYMMISLLFIWSILFGAYFIAFSFLVAGVTLFFFKRRFFTKRKVIKTLIGISIPFFVIISIYNYNNRMKHYSELLSQTDPIEKFSLFDKAGIYGLNIIMGVVAYPFYPEVSIETLSLMFSNESGERSFSSSFLMKSRKIKNEVERAVIKLEKSNKQSISEKVKITWRAGEYVMGSKEARVALALNPCELTISVKKGKDKIKISVEGKTNIAYPKRSRIILLVKNLLLKKNNVTPATKKENAIK